MPAALRRVGVVASRPGRAEMVLLAIVLLVAFALRVHRLAVPTLTGDEWFMLRNAHEGPAWIVAQARVFEPHPLLYYLGFWLWVQVAGATEWAMRYPSALFGVLLTGAVWRLARDAGGVFAGLAAGTLAALNPYLIAQSQNARNYAMVAALSVLATALLLLATSRGSRWRAYVVVILLALHTHLNALLVAVAHVGWVALRAALRREPVPRPALRAGALTAALFLPWLGYAAPALSSYRGYFPERVGPIEVAQRTLVTFGFGQHASPRRLFIAAFVLAALLGCAWALWRAWRCRDARALLPLSAAAVPVGGAAALFLVRPMFEERYLIVAAPAVLAVVALGAALLARAHLVVGLLALGGLIVAVQPALASHYPSVEESRPDWRALAAWIAQSERPGDAVLITGHGVHDQYGYYGRGRSPVALAADPDQAEADLTALLATRPRGVFHLPYWESPTDRLAHERLSAVGFAGPTRWFRGQRAQYFAMPPENDPPPTPVGAVWSGTIELVEAAVAPTSVAPGDVVRVLLTWRTLGQASDLKLSLRLLDRDGRTVGQLDRRPVDTEPFPNMPIGEDTRDGHAVRLADSARPGPLTVALLLYEPEGARAVAVEGERSRLVEGSRELIVLGHVEVVARP